MLGADVARQVQDGVCHQARGVPAVRAFRGAEAWQIDGVDRAVLTHPVEQGADLCSACCSVDSMNQEQGLALPFDISTQVAVLTGDGANLSVECAHMWPLSIGIHANSQCTGPPTLESFRFFQWW